MKSPTSTLFVDTETTGLHPSQGHQIWELAVIVRKPGRPATEDTEHVWHVHPTDLGSCSPEGLRISRYYQRCTVAGESPGCAKWWFGLPGQRLDITATAPTDSGWLTGHPIASLLDRGRVHGIVPAFDTAHLTALLGRMRQMLTTDYHPVDVTDLAAGYLIGRGALGRGGIAAKEALAAEQEGRRLPSDRIAELLGVTIDPADRHTALGDARLARDIFDAVHAQVNPRDL